MMMSRLLFAQLINFSGCLLHDKTMSRCFLFKIRAYYAEGYESVKLSLVLMANEVLRSDSVYIFCIMPQR